MPLTKQARTLSDAQQRAALNHVRGASATPERDSVILLLSYRAGLRAVEVAAVTWRMVRTADGGIAADLSIVDGATKGGRGGRVIPLHPDLAAALAALLALSPDVDDGAAIVCSRKGGGPLRPNAIVHWFARLYAELGMAGCSSHSGRRTFVTRLAKSITSAGGTLKAVQQLAGHSSITTTMLYIDESEDAKRRAVSML